VGTVSSRRRIAHRASALGCQRLGTGASDRSSRGAWRALPDEPLRGRVWEPSQGSHHTGRVRPRLPSVPWTRVARPLACGRRGAVPSPPAEAERPLSRIPARNPRRNPRGHRFGCQDGLATDAGASLAGPGGLASVARASLAGEVWLASVASPSLADGGWLASVARPSLAGRVTACRPCKSFGGCHRGFGRAVRRIRTEAGKRKQLKYCLFMSLFWHSPWLLDRGQRVLNLRLPGSPERAGKL
jgi:hypothetical protein